MKKELAIGICFGLAGILCTCLFGYEYFTTYGFLNAYHIPGICRFWQIFYGKGEKCL